MGLDITAYSKLRAVGPKTDGSEIRLYDHPGFPGRAAGVDCTQEHVCEGKEYGFSAGSYSGYNAWRSDLAQLAGHESARAVWQADLTEGPFIELINFADNEGTIGPVVSAKLAKDFVDFQEKAGMRGNFAEGYALFRRAFELAADGGAVCFH